jgi:hypothetical protein
MFATDSTNITRKKGLRIDFSPPFIAFKEIPMSKNIAWQQRGNRIFEICLDAKNAPKNQG